MKVILRGLNHESAPVEVREKLAVDDPAPLLQKLVDCEEIDEAVLFSTCNRVEVVALGRSLEGARHRLISFFKQDLVRGELPIGSDLEAMTYEHRESDAMRHVLRVTSALDSMVVGEPQILGQAKDAYRAAVECGTCGPILGRLFQHAFSCAKRVRTETRIAERPVSIARVAVDLAKQIFENFGDKNALLIGAGEMIENALDVLRRQGLESICVINRTQQRAEALAAKYGATANGLDKIEEALTDADMVLTSIASDTPILTVDLVSRAVRNRGQRPLFVIDIGVPRNADPAIDALDNVYRYDLDDMGAVAADNAGERQREAACAEAIVAEEQQIFYGWLSALRAVPTIRRLRGRAEAIRSSELERTLARTEFGEAEQAAVDALTKSIVNKILHPPISRLKKQAEREEGVAYLDAVQMLFDLNRDDDPTDRE